LLMKRLSTLTWKHLSSKRSHEFVAISIAHRPGNPQEIDDAIKNMRTDLDRFSHLEIESLIDSGYARARAQLIARGWAPPSAPTGGWCPVPRSSLDSDAKGRILQKSSRRRWLPLVTAITDPYEWALLVLLFVIGTAVVYFL